MTFLIMWAPPFGMLLEKAAQTHVPAPGIESATASHDSLVGNNFVKSKIFFTYFFFLLLQKNWVTGILPP